MALLNHERNQEQIKPPKKLLTRGPKVEVANKVDRMDIEEKANTKFQSKIEREKEKKSITTIVTEPVNLRVDNHIRNKISALIIMGHGDSQKDMVERLVNLYVEDLETSDYKRFSDLVNIYEDKDIIRHNKK